MVLPPELTATYGAPLTTVTTKVALIAGPFNVGHYNPPADVAVAHLLRSLCPGGQMTCAAALKPDRPYTACVAAPADARARSPRTTRRPGRTDAIERQRGRHRRDRRSRAFPHVALGVIAFVGWPGDCRASPLRDKAGVRLAVVRRLLCHEGTGRTGAARTPARAPSGEPVMARLGTASGYRMPSERASWAEVPRLNRSAVWRCSRSP